MTIAEEADYLSNVDLFSGLERERLRLLALTSIEPVSYEAGEFLFEEGDVADSAYVVVDGMVEVQVLPSQRTPTTVAICKNGVVGETSLLCDTKRRATARAAGPVRALRIDKESFEHLVFECPDVAAKLLRTMARQHEALVTALLSR